MIPKIIHYCWFGGKPLPNDVKKCIASWEKYCPDYEIKCWNEDNFDVNTHEYMREAYNAKRWAFVSDLARLIIVFNNGGIYLDTDVELIKPLDNVVENNSFFLGIEKDTDIIHGKESIYVATGLGFGAEAKNQIIDLMLREYDKSHFCTDNGTYDLLPCPVRNSRALEKIGFKGKDEMIKVYGGTIYPSEFFCPVEFSSSISNFTNNTVSIHHYSASWKTKKEKIVEGLKLSLKRIVYKCNTMK